MMLWTPQKTLVYPKLVYGAKGGGKGGGGGAPRAAVESPNTLQNNSIARLIDILSEGEIAGLTDGAKSIFLDKTPLQNKDGSYNFEGVTWDIRLGTPNQAYVPGFSAVESEFSVGTEVKHNTPITRTVENAEFDAVRVTVQVSALYSQSNTTGDINGASVEFAFDLSSGGGPYTRQFVKCISGKTMSPYQEQYRIELPPGGAPWNLRMLRLSPDSDSTALKNDIAWASWTGIIDNKVSYADTAYVALTVNAAQFGANVPARAYELYGRIIQVPSNYNPQTREYSGIWDGTFKSAYSNNNAWVLYDMLTHGRYGAGREIPDVLLNKEELYAIGRYCDEPVSDGSGGLEPRFSFNGACVTREEAMSFLAALAGTCRTQIFAATGGLWFSQDRPQCYKRLLTPANVVDGLFTYEGSAWSSRHSVAVVSWLDPANGYEAALEVVEDPEMIRAYGWRQLDIAGFGCTSRGQARRWGLMALDAEKNATEAISFSTGLDCADVAPGDVVAVADPNYAGARAGGRLAKVDENGATLDASFDFDGAEEYRLGLILPDNSIVEAPLVNPGQSADRVEFAEPLETLPKAGAVYIILATNLTPRLFRIVNVTEGEGLTFEFTGILYDPGKYDRVENGLEIAPPPTSLIPAGPLSRPSNLAYSEYLYLKSGLSPVAGATITWSCKDPRVVAFEVQWQEPGQHGWQGKIATGVPSFDMDINEPGFYIFRVRSVGGLAGEYSAWVQLGANMNGLYSVPADVTGFRGNWIGEYMTLTWDRAKDLHLAGYQIRFNPLAQNAVWEASGVILDNLSPSTTSAQVPLQRGTYLIKAISVMDKQSENAATLVNSVSMKILNYNVVQTSVQNPAWSGKVKNIERYGTVIKLTQLDKDWFQPEGVYYFDPPYNDLGVAYSTRVIPNVFTTGVGISDNIFNEPDLFSISNIFNLQASSGWECVTQFSLTKDNPANPTAVWSDWATCFTPFDAVARAFKFRLILRSLDGVTTPVVAAASISLDMPDRMASGRDVPIPVEGKYIEILPPFKETPAIAEVLIQGGDAADYSVISDKSRKGFFVKIVNGNTGQAQSGRSIDWVARGYGNEDITEELL